MSRALPNIETFLASASSLAFFFFSLGPASFWAFLSASLAAAFAFLAAFSAAFASCRIPIMIGEVYREVLSSALSVVGRPVRHAHRHVNELGYIIHTKLNRQK